MGPQKGFKMSEEHKKKIGDANRGKRKTWLSLKMMGEGNSQWKGNNITYHGIHAWVRRHKPKPVLCEECNICSPYDLANVSGEYRRDITDFRWLCRKCHMINDGRLYDLYLDGQSRIKHGRYCLPILKEGEAEIRYYMGKYKVKLLPLSDPKMRFRYRVFEAMEEFPCNAIQLMMQPGDRYMTTTHYLHVKKTCSPLGA